MMYFRFVLFLAAGMAGLMLVLTVLLDVVFCNWDPHAEIKRYIDEVSRKKRREMFPETEYAPPGRPAAARSLSPGVLG